MMSLLRSIKRKWHARQRAIDIATLWPECCRLTPTLDHAKATFAVHAYNDSAWTSLGDDGIYDAIEALKFPEK